MSKHVALLGYPLRHSVSPVFQQAAIDYYQMDITYEPWEVEPANLEAEVSRLRDSSVLGANVTIPHKETVKLFLDNLDSLAQHIGAVNTIVNTNSNLTGHNTDAKGLLDALRRDGNFNPEGKNVILLGAGGVARAAAFALAKAKVNSLTIANRTVDRANQLAASLSAIESVNIQAIPINTDILAQKMSDCHLIINCTALGMKHSPGEGQLPIAADTIPRHALVFDLIYNPLETPLLREAKARGSQVLGGLSMLVYQGAASFELWTGKEAPIDLMLKTAQNALV